MTYDEIVKGRTAHHRVGRRKYYVVDGEKWLVRAYDKKVWYRGQAGTREAPKIFRHGKKRDDKNRVICLCCKEPLKRVAWLVGRYRLHAVGFCSRVAPAKKS